MAPKQPKRTKAEIQTELEQVQKIQKQRVLARLLFPSVEQLETIYDAQTAFTAAAGHIKYGMMKAENALKVGDVEMDLDKGKDGPMKHAVTSMIELVRDEPANEAMRLLEQMGAKLPEFLAQRHLSDPMSTISAKEYIAE